MGYFHLALRLIRKNLRTLFLFELLYKLIGGLLLAPAIYGLFSLALRLAGIRYVTEQNFLWFLGRPGTIAAALLALLMLTAFTLFEVTTLTHGLHASYHDQKITVHRMLGRGSMTALRALVPGNWQLIVFVALMVPFAHGLLLSGFLPNISLPFPVRALLRRHIWLVPVLCGLVLALYWLVLRWLFAVQVFTLSRVSFPEARKQSIRLTRRRLARDLLSLLAWLLILLVLLALLFALLAALGLLAVKLLAPARKAVSAALTLLTLMLTIFGLVASALAVPVTCALSSAMYYSERWRAKQPVEPYWFYPPRGALHVRARRSRVVTVVTLCGAGTVLAGAIASGIANLSNLADADITAHRGDSASAPENTLPAFESAIEHGADYIEIDVQLTADGEIAVIHDASLRRVGGVNLNVRDLSYGALRNIDVGSWFDAEFAGTSVPTLAETLALVDGRAELLIELKSSEPPLAERVVQIIRAFDAQDWCVVMSPDYAQLGEVKRLAPEQRTAYLLKAVYGSLAGLEYADAFSIRAGFVTRRLVEQVHREDKQVYAWTVNQTSIVRRLLDMRVDNIITDDPVMAREVQSSERAGDLLSKLVYKLFK